MEKTKLTVNLTDDAMNALRALADKFDWIAWAKLWARQLPARSSYRTRSARAERSLSRNLTRHSEDRPEVSPPGGAAGEVAEEVDVAAESANREAVGS